MREVQDDCSITSKSTALQGFGMEIADHQVGGTVLDSNVATLDVIMNEVIPDIKMTSFLSTGLSTILFQQHCALVALIDDVIYHLGFQK